MKSGSHAWAQACSSGSPLTLEPLELYWDTFQGTGGLPLKGLSSDTVDPMKLAQLWDGSPAMDRGFPALVLEGRS